MPPIADMLTTRVAERPATSNAVSKTVGIAAIATYEPPTVLGNEWFNGELSRKFVQHTGIVSRRIAWDDEVTMAQRAVENLQAQTGWEPGNCVAVVLACSSLLDRETARRHLGEEQAQCESPRAVARRFVARLGIPSARAFGINWGCCGYARAMQIAFRLVSGGMRLRGDQSILVVTVNRTSRITDFGCKVTAPIFGDFAQATLLSGADNRRCPMELALLYAAAERQPADRPFFQFHLRENVVVPAPDGGRIIEPRRLVYSLDMMGLGDAAPRAMANAAAKALQATNIRPEEVDLVIPHQAGTGVVRLTALKLDELGIRSEVLNGLTQNVGNISSSSVPYAMQQNWARLQGTVVCPTAAVGLPGQASVSQGCIVLKAVRQPNAAPTLVHGSNVLRFDAPAGR